MANIRLDHHSAARGAADGASSWIEMLARVGYASRGVLYIIIGALAFTLAIGSGGETTGSRGALQEIADKPLGNVALFVIALGLAGYGVWRLIQAAANPQRLGDSVKDAFKRAGYALRGVIHVGLAVAAVRIAMGSRSSDGGESSQQTESWTARVMEWPAGRWLVAIAAAIMIGYGLYRIYQAWKADLGKQMRVAEMSRETSRRIIHVSRFGIAARGVVFVLVGWLFMQAALQYDASEAGGVAEALDSLRSQPYGPWLLGVVALGLVAYGVHSILQSRYRRIDV